jgi:hypothetical protein
LKKFFRKIVAWFFLKLEMEVCPESKKPIVDFVISHRRVKTGEFVGQIYKEHKCSCGKLIRDEVEMTLFIFGNIL